MQGINYITKTLSNSKVWKSISRGECNLSQIKELYPKFPKQTASATHIIGTHPNGKTEEFLIYKDKLGKNLGSATERADGSAIFIQIEELSGRKKRFVKSVHDSELNCQKKTTTIMDVFRHEDGSLLDVTIARNELKSNYKDNVLDLFWEIKSNLTSIFRSYIKSLSHMNPVTHETKLSTVSYSNDIKVDTTNPYFKTLLIDKVIALVSAYADISKKHGVLDIKPPLHFSNWKGMPSVDDTTLGQCLSDNSQIAIRSHLGDYELPMGVLIKNLAHECEHAFVQNKNVHLAKIRSLKSKDSDSIKFFEGIESRFKQIEKNSIEYKKAQEYNNELLNYRKLVDTIGHDNLTIEKEAGIAGDIAFAEYIACKKEIESCTLIDVNDIQRECNLWWLS